MPRHLKDFSIAMLTFLRDDVPKNWRTYCDRVTDNFRIINRKDFRVLTSTEDTNGIAKRARTSHRFKKVARSLKRLRDELVELKVLKPKQYPSFLVECLVYSVADDVFLSTESDERYDRIVQVVERINVLLAYDPWMKVADEINGIKYLFRDGQAWSVEDALAFGRAARLRVLGS